ncbi:MAG: sulfatase-like hydrolase/transferase [Phycisphaeraceae bacterium]|nr:sulfatase-like hydrolase/transferase [Phycisphaeraceae bacterium]
MNRPNILLFVTDDHGRWALPCYGAREIHAPTLDFLAATGIRAEQAYTPCAVCSPARASLFTGRMPSAHGIHDWLSAEDGDQHHPGLTGQTLLPALLKQVGYATGLSGKWHCGHPDRPADGFDTWFTMAHGTTARFGAQPFYEGNSIVELHGHQAVHITDRAARFLLERDRRRPFFLTVGYTDTHTPHSHAPQRLSDQYRNTRFATVPEESFAACHGHVRFAPRPDAGERQRQLADYAASVSMIDQQIARLMDVLENLGELENTIVIYTSDHGHMNGHHGLHTKSNATVPANFIDESIQVPLIWSFPDDRAAARQGEAERDRVLHDRVDHCDLFATILDAAGLDARSLADSVRSPGQSYLAQLRGAGSDRQVSNGRRQEQFCEYGNARMVRTDRHKLIVRHPGPNGHWPDEFYELENDPRERTNAIKAPQHADTIAALRAKLDDFFARYEEPSRRGTEIEQQPPCNRVSPWLATPDEVIHQ